MSGADNVVSSSGIDQYQQPYTMKKTLTILFSSLVLNYAMGSVLHMGPEDLVSNAHVILTGTCTEVRSELLRGTKGIVRSHATFNELEVLRLIRDGAAPTGTELTVSYAGGTTEGISMMTCLSPHFEVGQRYVLFLLNDGAHYVTPLVGASQGLFKVGPQRPGEQPVVMDMSHRGICGLVDNCWIRTIEPLMPGADTHPDMGMEKDHAEEPMDDAHVTGDRALTVGEFGELVRSIPLVPPTMEQWFDPSADLPMVPEDRTPSTRPVQAQQRSTLGACMEQEVYIWFEQNDAISGFATWATIDTYAKGLFDVYMNIYSNTANPTDGFQESNGENEIAGWMNSNELSYYYGDAWPAGAIGVTYWWGDAPCGEINETDIILRDGMWWVSDWNDAFQTTAINYRNVILHEFGHTWGYMTGPNYDENYDYAYPSVMHKYYHSLWEDGKELHARDASIIRSRYDDQTAIKDVDDLGVESYRALEGSDLLNSFVSDASVTCGQDLVINRITVENNSDDTQNNIHLRFYLSTNRSLTSSDHQVGDFALGNMVAVSRKIANYTLSTADVPSGTYYIGAKVTRSGYGSDDRSANDITWTTYSIQVDCNVGVEGTLGIGTLSIYPNPTEDIVSITLPEGVSVGDLSLHDPTGRMLMEMAIQGAMTHGQVTVDLSSYPAGIYMLSINAADQHRYMARIVRR